MIGRAGIIAGFVISLLIGGLGGAIVFGCTFVALLLLITAVCRGWYR